MFFPGEGYGAELRRKHLYEAAKYSENLREHSRADDGGGYGGSGGGGGQGGSSGHPLFGHINPVNLLKMFLHKSRTQGNSMLGKELAIDLSLKHDFSGHYKISYQDNLVHFFRQPYALSQQH